VSLVSCFAGYIETAKNGHLEVVQFLIKSRADIHTDNDYALRWAAQNGHLEVVQFLIKSGANVHADHDRALRCATENRHLEVVRGS